MRDGNEVALQQGAESARVARAACDLRDESALLSYKIPSLTLF
jgi:hypothetical protein